MLAEIKAMLAEGKIQREIAEHFGFKDKQVVKELLKRERRKERKLEAGIQEKSVLFLKRRVMQIKINVC